MPGRPRNISDEAALSVPNKVSATRRKSLRQRSWFRGLLWTLCIVALTFSGGAWLSTRASVIEIELSQTAKLIPQLKEQIAQNEHEKAVATVAQIRSHTDAAKQAANDPVWTLASNVPWLGPNFSAVAEVARSADDVAGLGLSPLVAVYGSLNWDALVPTASGTDLEPLKSASPAVSSAAHAVSISADRLSAIDDTRLLREVADPLNSARDQLQSITGALQAASDAAKIIPNMLGAEAPRSYLLMVQNNAEARASGGIPGALAVLTVDNGQLSLTAQSTANDLGIMAPVISTDPEQQQIYSSRLGKFLQDVNLTPDFPTAASTAQAMWERHSGQKVDGVLSIDPVALSYILNATGPITLSKPELVTLAGNGLPTKLDGKNILPTLLSDVYAKVQEPMLQDAYFAGVAQETFAALAGGQGDTKGLIDGLSKGAAEGRVLVWSNSTFEQTVIAQYPISGSISGPSVMPAQFGVYFNDGTGAKMDYYVSRSVQLIRQCLKDGYEQTTVRVTSTNNAPIDAASVLPDYVTGGGIYGVPMGSVQTNVVVYGPAQSTVETALRDGKPANLATHMHGNRPLAVMALQLAPGQTSTLDFSFGKIVQHTEPNVVVTPTVQDVKDVILPTISASCEAK